MQPTPRLQAASGKGVRVAALAALALLIASPSSSPWLAPPAGLAGGGGAAAAAACAAAAAAGVLAAGPPPPPPPLFAEARPSLAVSTTIGGGLTNQRIRLRQFLVLAVVKRLAVFLPGVSPSREAFVREYNDPAKVGWHAVPFGEVFDVPRLAACLAPMGVRVLGVCAPHSCPLAVTENSSAPLLALMAADAALRAPSGHVYLGGGPIFEQRAQDMPVADAVDECIAYAPPLQAAAAQVWAAFLAAWRPAAAAATVGLHVRLEDDGAAYFGRGEMSTAMYRAAVLDRIANCVRSLVPPGRDGAPLELSFYVASGEPLSAMQGFADEFPRTSTKDALAPAALAAIRHLFSDAAAGVDHIVLLQTDFFFGYYESTFSLQVANERFRRGRASALHNAPWQEPAVCVPHQLWRNWR